jgi:hypothetical protein
MLQRMSTRLRIWGREFESLRARQHLAPTFRAKNTAVLRNLQATQARANFARNALVHVQCLAPARRNSGDRHRP